MRAILGCAAAAAVLAISGHASATDDYTLHIQGFHGKALVWSDNQWFADNYGSIQNTHTSVAKLWAVPLNYPVPHQYVTSPVSPPNVGNLRVSAAVQGSGSCYQYATTGAYGASSYNFYWGPTHNFNNSIIPNTVLLEPVPENLAPLNTGSWGWELVCSIGPGSRLGLVSALLDSP
jgi:hypothetical protein